MVAAVLVAGSEKAAARRLGLSHSTVKHHLANARSRVGAETTAQLVWILAPWLPEPEGRALADEWRPARRYGRAPRPHHPQPGEPGASHPLMRDGVSAGVAPEDADLRARATSSRHSSRPEVPLLTRTRLWAIRSSTGKRHLADLRARRG